MDTPVTRQSHALEQFIASLAGSQGLRVLDLGGACQENITYITSLGHRLSSEDFLRTLENVFGEGDFYSNQEREDLVEVFTGQVLDFQPDYFDGALVWDTLQYLSPKLLEMTLYQLRTILRPGALMLSFFHTDEKATTAPMLNFRIQDFRTLMLDSRGVSKPAQYFNNRTLERMFEHYKSTKFFLTRDNLREVIVRR
jgi:hypothetical protein